VATGAADIGGFGSAEGGGVDGCSASESSEDYLYSSDGKRKLDESEDGGVREESDSSIYFCISMEALLRNGGRGRKKVI
jgi:hypothetical protein